MQLPKKKNFLKNSNEDGFSLVEIMVAAGIMSTLLLFLYQTLGNQQKTARKIEVRVEADAIINDIRQTLGDPASCKATFGGKNAVSTPPGDGAINITRIKRVLPVPPLAPPLPVVESYLSNTNFNSAQPYGSARIKIISYRLSSTEPNVGLAAGSPFGTTSLTVTFRYNMIDPIIERKIRISVETISSANRAILNCGSTGAIADFEDRYVNVAGDEMFGNLIMKSNSNINIEGTGNIEIKGTGSLIMSSDKRLKKHIVPLMNVTAKINKLRPVSYLWKQDDKPATGLIAQEVQKVFPELVHQRNDSDLLAIDYLQLSPFIVKGLQETNEENVLLRKKMKSLNNELNQVKEYLCQKDPQSSLCANSDLKR